MIVVLEILVAIYMIPALFFTLFIDVFLLTISVKFWNYLEELGIDRLLLLNPFFFPVKTVKKIIESKQFTGKKKLQRSLSFIYFYKIYIIVGAVVCVPCFYIICNSS